MNSTSTQHLFDALSPTLKGEEPKILPMNSTSTQHLFDALSPTLKGEEPDIQYLEIATAYIP